MFCTFLLFLTKCTDCSDSCSSKALVILLIFPPSISDALERGAVWAASLPDTPYTYTTLPKASASFHVSIRGLKHQTLPFFNNLPLLTLSLRCSPQLTKFGGNSSLQSLPQPQPVAVQHPIPSRPPQAESDVKRKSSGGEGVAGRPYGAESRPPRSRTPASYRAARGRVTVKATGAFAARGTRIARRDIPRRHGRPRRPFRRDPPAAAGSPGAGRPSAAPGWGSRRCVPAGRRAARLPTRTRGGGRRPRGPGAAGRRAALPVSCPSVLRGGNVAFPTVSQWGTLEVSAWLRLSPRRGADRTSPPWRGARRPRHRPAVAAAPSASRLRHAAASRSHPHTAPGEGRSPAKDHRVAGRFSPDACAEEGWVDGRSLGRRGRMSRESAMATAGTAVAPRSFAGSCGW